MATAASTSSPLSLPALPWAENALEPVISAKTISFHYGKHHKTYVENANKMIVGTELADLPLDQIVRATAGKADRVGIFNNAAQAWNHEFYWKGLKPKGGGEPPSALKSKMDAAFGGVDACKKELANAAVQQFGSGWAWLVLDGDKLKVVKTGNADTPIAHNQKPLLTIDVLGARLLPRLSEQAGGLRQCADRQAGELGVRCAEPRKELRMPKVRRARSPHLDCGRGLRGRAAECGNRPQ